MARETQGSPAGARGQDAGRDAAHDGAGSKAGWVLLGLAALLAAGSVTYNVIDAGGTPDTATRGAEAAPTIEELRAAAEASPGDADAWRELAFALFGREDYAGAARAYQRATRIDPDAAELYSALGEALLYAVDSSRPDADPMPQEAVAAFERAVELDPTDPRARYFLAARKDLAGDHEGALRDWLAILADTPPGAPWERNLVQTIEQVGKINEIAVEQRIAAAMEGRMPAMRPGAGALPGGEGAGAGIAGPSAEQVAAAQSLSSDEREAMIAGMVSRLETRLASEPGNLDGWVMLMRSRVNLGEPDKARAALARAIAANPEEEAELRRQAALLGIG